jgi:hypothetical protein
VAHSRRQCIDVCSISHPAGTDRTAPRGKYRAGGRSRCCCPDKAALRLACERSTAIYAVQRQLHAVHTQRLKTDIR